VTTLAIVPAFVACRDKDKNDRDLRSKSTVSSVPTTPATDNTGIRTDDKYGTSDTKLGTADTKLRTDTKFGTDTKLGTADTKIGSTDTKIDTTETRVGNFGKSDALATATLNGNGSSKLHGTAMIHGIGKKGDSVTINLTDTAPGIYTARIFDAADCSEAPLLEIETGNVSVGSAASTKSPDVYAEVADITVAEDGNGILDSSLKNVSSPDTDAKFFSTKIIAIYPKKVDSMTAAKTTGTTTGKTPCACGVLRTERARDVQGS
jgi:hypothetical protein